MDSATRRVIAQAERELTEAAMNLFETPATTFDDYIGRVHYLQGWQELIHRIKATDKNEDA